MSITNKLGLTSLGLDGNMGNTNDIARSSELWPKTHRILIIDITHYPKTGEIKQTETLRVGRFGFDGENPGCG